MENIGIIDLGSNTARLLIVNVKENGHFQIIDQLKESTRLGEGMEKDGFLKPARIQDTIKTLKMFKRLCDAKSMGILQARKLDWIAKPSSRGSSQPRSQTQVSYIAGRFFTS